MNRLEAIEKTAEEISSLEGFLTELGPKNPVNIIDPCFTEESLTRLACACEEAMAWLGKEADKEEAMDIITHEEKKRELCINDSMF